MYERSSDNGCCFEVESVPDAAKVADVIVASTCSPSPGNNLGCAMRGGYTMFVYVLCILNIGYPFQPEYPCNH